MSIMKKQKCEGCGAVLEINTYRKYIKCPYCGTKFPFEGFDYEPIDYSLSMLADSEFEADCPSCRGRHMILKHDSNLWRCFDCGYKISKQELKEITFWFCDDCETLLNIQPGFSGNYEKWTCRECGCHNNITEENIF